MSDSSSQHHSPNPVTENGLEQAAAVARMTGLIVVTLLFGMAWSQAKPDPELLAQRAMIQPNFSGKPIPVMLVEHHQQSAHVATIARTETHSSVAVPALHDSHVVLDEGNISYGTQISIVRGDLTLESDELAAHIAQLPMGIEAGRYRIVDSQGGTGWLIIHSAMVLPNSQLSDGIASTHHDNQTVRFIKVSEIAEAPGRQVR
ncbi:MAG: hypothetical protein KDA69_07785 [Planctomycetaceae bacterium]|nr:hypothetical protein [Planctomycetaceae bacterium]